MDHCGVAVYPNERLVTWPTTPRPFEKDPSDYSRAMPQIERRYDGWDNAKYALGISQAEVDAWSEGVPILEVGPGQCVSFDQLNALGALVFAVEPSFKSKFYTGMFRRYEREYPGRISAVNAADAPFVFSGVQFAAALAIGPNFQCYSLSADAVLAQVSGVLDTLEPTSSSFFTFDLVPGGEVCFGLCAPPGLRSKLSNFLLTKLLDDKGIRYDCRGYFDGRGPSTAIRIYKQGEDGMDAATVLNSISSQELQPYLAKAKNLR